MSYPPDIARLGEAGKWHVVAATRGTNGDTVVFTQCSLQLREIRSSLHVARVTRKRGAPTCKNCIRWLDNDNERWRLAAQEARKNLPKGGR